jgi:predicted RNA-binding Zn ribbon-like protein
MAGYSGPARQEPLAVELSNTIYAVGGEQLDGISDGPALAAWLRALGDRVPVAVREVDTSRVEDFHALRSAVREALQAAVDKKPLSTGALKELNRRSAADPQSLEVLQRGHKRDTRLRHHAPTPTDVVLGVIATDAIALVGGAHAELLRACEAPGCVLMFLKDHPRREWCSAACGNRARQARHYRRHRQHQP